MYLFISNILCCFRIHEALVEYFFTWMPCLLLPHSILSWGELKFIHRLAGKLWFKISWTNKVSFPVCSTCSWISSLLSLHWTLIVPQVCNFWCWTEGKTSSGLVDHSVLMANVSCQTMRDSCILLEFPTVRTCSISTKPVGIWLSFGIFTALSSLVEIVQSVKSSLRLCWVGIRNWSRDRQAILRNFGKFCHLFNLSVLSQ